MRILSPTLAAIATQKPDDWIVLWRALMERERREREQRERIEQLIREVNRPWHQ